MSASPEDVFRHLEDPDLVPRYAPGVDSVEDVNRSEQHIGDSFKVNYAVLGLKLPTKFVVSSYHKDSRIETRIEGAMRGTFDWSLAERAGGTDVTVRIDYEVAGGALGKGLDATVLKRVNEANTQRMLENLKDLVEGR
jgi:carbon monoxide dehydrogenase subunit G